MRSRQTFYVILIALFATWGCSAPPAPELTDVLTVVYLTNTEAPPDLREVEAAINKRFAERIGARVTMRPLPSGVIERQLDMMLASESPPDLFATDIDELHSRVTRNQIRPLDSLLDFAGRNILKTIDPVYLRVGKIQGQTYAVPPMKDYASFYGALLRSDLIGKYNVDMTRIRRLADLSPVLRMIKEGEEDIVPLVLSDFRNILSSYNNEYDNLGDDAGVLIDFRDPSRVSNLFESRFYSDAVSLARDWYVRGYLATDADTSRETAEDYLAAGKAFAALCPQKPGFAGQESRITGYSLRSVPLTKPVATSDKVGKTIWAISAKSPRPVTAMRFLELLYTDAELVNLIDWGIEGKHYKRLTTNIITLPDRIGPAPIGYQPNHGWQFGNQFLSYVFLGDLPDIWKKMEDFNRQAIKSPALGFTFDPTPIKSTYQAVRNVMNDYRNGLETGALDPVVALPVFKNKLREAGIDKVIEEKQRQLDAWIGR
ncbi:MAG: ABC transporter substrate-binding protein [Treponemataceae bacterium]